MSLEALTIPIKVDLSAMRTATANMRAELSRIPDVDVGPLNAQLAVVDSQVKSISGQMKSDLQNAAKTVKVDIDTTDLQEVAKPVKLDVDTAGVVEAMEATQKAVNDVGSAASQAQFDFGGLSRTFTAVSVAAKPLTLLSGNLGVVATSASLAADGAAQVAAGFGLASTVATYLASGLGIVLAPLRGLVIIPKIIAVSFGIMAAAILTPIKLVIGAVTLMAKGIWTLIQPIVAVAAAIFKFKVALGSIQIQIALLGKFLGVLPPRLRAVVIGLVAIGAAGRAGSFAVNVFVKALGVANTAMRLSRIALKVLTLQWVSAATLTVKSAAQLGLAALTASKALGRMVSSATIAGMRSLGSATANVASTIGGKLTSVASTAVKGLLAIGVASSGWGVSLAAEAEQAEIGFTTMLGSADAAKGVLAELEQFAASTPFQLDSLRDGAKQLLNAGVSTRALTGELTMLGDIAAGTGKPIQDFVRIYSKVRSTGKVSLETLNQLAERGVPIYSALSTQLGKSREEMLDMISKGKVGFSDLNGALQATATGAGQFAGGMMAQSQSVSGLWSTFKDNVAFSVRELGGELINAFDFKSMLNRGISFFQAIKTQIAAARPAFIATAEVVKAAFSSIYEVVSVVFTGIMSVLGVTSGNWMTTFVTMAAIAAFTFREWPTLAELAFVNLSLFVVRSGSEFVHLFTGILPALFSWFTENWRDIFTDAGNVTMTFFKNLGKNVVAVMTEIWDYIASGGTKSFSVAWTPLLEGFESSIKELPDIPERVLGELEKSLAAQSASLTDAVSGGMAEEITKNLDMLSEFKSTKVELPELPDITPGGLSAEDGDTTAGDTGKSRTDFSVDSLDRGSEAALKAIFAANTDKTPEKQLSEQKQTNKHLAKIASKQPFTFHMSPGVT